MSYRVKRNDHIYLDGKTRHPKGAHLIGYYLVLWLEQQGFVRVESLTTGMKYRIHESQIARKTDKKPSMFDDQEIREPKERRES